MDKYIIDKNGRAEERVQGIEGKTDVHFPLCLAVKYEGKVPVECNDFMLNVNQKKVFLPMNSPFPDGAKLMLHFYIPPDAKLLAELKGTVIDQRHINNLNGSMVKISDFLNRRLRKLEQYLEEKNHLVDIKA